MKLRKLSAVRFCELTHTYYKSDWSRLVGVTFLMKKYGLSPDYSSIPADVLKKAAERGTAIHKILEAYDNNEAILETPELKAYKALGLNVVCSEYLVSDLKFVASSIDKVIYVDENTVDLGDVKTTSTVHREAVAWQLSIYRHLFQKMNKGIKVRNLFCIHVRDGEAKLVKVTPVKDSEVSKFLRRARADKDYKPDGDIWETTSAEVELKQNSISLAENLIRIAELKSAIKALETANAEINDQLISYMKENKMDCLRTDKGTFTLKEAYERVTLDSKAIQKDLPEVYSKYARTSVTRASILFKASE